MHYTMFYIIFFVLFCLYQVLRTMGNEISHHPSSLAGIPQERAELCHPKRHSIGPTKHVSEGHKRYGVQKCINFFFLLLLSFFSHFSFPLLPAAEQASFISKMQNVVKTNGVEKKREKKKKKIETKPLVRNPPQFFLFFFFPTFSDIEYLTNLVLLKLFFRK